MCKFLPVIYSPRHNLFSNLHYIPAIQACYSKYRKYLQDDFAHREDDICSFIEQVFPFFWAIETQRTGEFMGFVYLDNLTGGKMNFLSESSSAIFNKNILYSAELTTCFEKRAWGDFTRYSAKLFLRKCFCELGLYKVKAQIYPENFRVKTLMKSAGFEYESTLKAETLRNGKPQDIDVYAVYRNYYYNKR